jgi:hypothetical protein
MTHGCICDEDLNDHRADLPGRSGDAVSGASQSGGKEFGRDNEGGEIRPHLKKDFTEDIYQY